MHVDDQYDARDAGRGAGRDQDPIKPQDVPLMRLLKQAYEALKGIEYIDMMDDELRCPECLGSPQQDGHKRDCKVALHYLLKPIIEGKPIPEGPPCSECGHYKDDVRKQVCTYTEEMHNRRMELTMCDDCALERATWI